MLRSRSGAHVDQLRWLEAGEGGDRAMRLGARGEMAHRSVSLWKSNSRRLCVREGWLAVFGARSG
jgi:hypothetical protein